MSEPKKPFQPPGPEDYQAVADLLTAEGYAGVTAEAVEEEYRRMQHGGKPSGVIGRAITEWLYRWIVDG